MGSHGSLDSLAGIPLHAALEGTGTGLAACDAEGRLTLLSPALQELFGLPFRPLDEESWPETFPIYRADGETLLSRHELPLSRARAGEFVRDAVVAVRRREGDLVHLKVNAAPLTDDAGEVAGAVALVQDVTVEVAAERVTEQLRRSLVQTVNHEFRTPLAVMLGHVELLREHRDDLPAELIESLEAIERAGWRMRDLVAAATDLIEQQERQVEAAGPAGIAPAEPHPVAPTT